MDETSEGGKSDSSPAGPETTGDETETRTDDDLTGGEVATVEVSEEEGDDAVLPTWDDLSLGKAVAYTAGGLLIYSGVTSVGSNLFGGALTVFLGVFALPVVRAQLSPSRRVMVSRWTKLAAVILAVLVGDILLGTELLPASVREPARRILL
jgi:hypothetical protein